MKNKKIIYCSFVITALLMTGCGKRNEQPQPSTTPETSTPAAETTTPATQDTSSIITEDEAKVIALNHANLVQEEVTFSKCELDEDFDSTNYDVEFHTEDRIEYDYEIDAYTGEILGYDWDGDDTLFNESVTEGGTNASANADTANNSQNPTSTIITVEDAKKIALEQVPGAAEEHIREFDRDYDDGRLKYEVEIFFEDKEYSFDIDAKDGTILERDAD